MRIKLLILVAIAAASTNALAEDIPEPQSAEKCFPAEGLVKFIDKMSNLKPARADTLEAVFSAKFEREDEAQLLPKLWSRDNGTDKLFNVNADGRVTDFHQRLKTLPQTAELCGQSLTPEGEEPKVGISIDNDILFKNSTGPYSLAELQDGVADGKSFYKKMMPGPMALLVPSMTHIMLQYEDENAPLVVSFTQAGQPVSSPPAETFSGTYVISLEDIEASGADLMSVGGGAFKLMPVPSIKKLKSFGFKDEDEDDNDKSKDD